MRGSARGGAPVRRVPLTVAPGGVGWLGPGTLPRSLRHPSNSGVEAPTMSTSRVLQHLYSLDASSPDFLRCLYCLIRSDEKEQYLSNLQGSDLTRLVDFLDDVCSSPSASSWLTKYTVQILDVAPITDDVSRRCLHKLRTICSQHAILPSSYTISGDLARVGDHPFALGGFSEVWKGTYNGRKVCIKHPRVSEKIREAVEKVSILCWVIFSCPPGMPIVT